MKTKTDTAENTHAYKFTAIQGDTHNYWKSRISNMKAASNVYVYWEWTVFHVFSMLCQISIWIDSTQADTVLWYPVERQSDNPAAAS